MPLSAIHVAPGLQPASPMPSRPTTPAGISDTSSDPCSLSDLESGWTDLSSNHSVSGRHSPAATSDPSDNEDDRSAIDIYEGGVHEASERLTPELNISEHTPSVESSPTAPPVHSPSPQQVMSDLALEDWVADALGSSLISDNVSLDSSTPHVSIRGSRAFRLAFPDPLSNSEDNILPSHAPSRTQSLSTEAASEAGGDLSAHTQTLSSRVSSFTRSLPSDRSLSIPDDDASYQDQSNRNYQLPSLELTPSYPVSYALSVILLGHPPLPHFKSMTVSTLMDMVAFVFKGSPDIPKGSGSSSIYEVPIHVHQQETCNTQPDLFPSHHILISDRTSGSSSFINFDAPDCPTVALVFIQPPLSSPSIPSLPANTLYLPLLLPSISDGFASSLLDLSPSVLFDHSVPNLATPNHGSRKSFALQQCVEMNILDKRLDGTRDILGVDEFIALPPQSLSTALAELIYSAVNKSEDVSGKVECSTGTKETHRFSALHKQQVIISALFVALLFGSTVLLRGTFSNAPISAQATPSPQSQRLWPIFNPFSNSAPSTVPTTPPPSAVTVEPLPRSRALMPASLRSLALSVFLTESASENVAGPSTVSDTNSDKDKETEGVGSAIRAVHEPPRVSVASLDAPDAPLTLDTPCSKLLPPLSQARSSAPNGKGKEKAVDEFPGSPTPFPCSLDSVSVRMSHALSPLFNAADHDLRELQEAIDALLHALLQLQGIASQGIGNVVQVLSKQAEQGVHDFASKVYNVASYRHARARYNARKVRDVGERYVGAAKQMLEAGLERARGNAKEVLTEGLAMKIASRAKRQIREESRNLKRQAREHRKSARNEAKTKRAECRQKKSRGAECIFQTVVAYMA